MRIGSSISIENKNEYYIGKWVYQHELLALSADGRLGYWNGQAMHWGTKKVSSTCPR